MPSPLPWYKVHSSLLGSSFVNAQQCCNLSSHGLPQLVLLECIHEYFCKGLRKKNSWDHIYFLFLSKLLFSCLHLISPSQKAIISGKKSSDHEFRFFYEQHVKGLVCYWMFLHKHSQPPFIPVYHRTLSCFFKTKLEWSFDYSNLGNN